MNPAPRNLTCAGAAPGQRWARAQPDSGQVARPPGAGVLFREANSCLAGHRGPGGSVEITPASAPDQRRELTT